MTAVTLQFDGVGKTYDGSTALENITLDVHEGLAVALVGHNGAGKTTMMKLLLGLIRPDSGRVRTLGVDPAGPDAPDTKRSLGFLPETVAFQQAMTGLDVLNFYARLKKEDLTKNPELMDKVGLGAAAKQRVKTYSKGMRQRLGLAQAFLGAPKVLLLDEPTTGLDPALRREFYNTLLSLKHDGATVLLSSHALTELEQQIDKVAIMNEGHLIAYGTMPELRRAANIPVRIRLHTRHGIAADIANQLGETNISKVNSQTVEFLCSPNDKMILIRRVSELGVDIEDIEIELPTLDQLYSHFRNGGRLP